MKICKDCSVSLSLKGLHGHIGSVTVPLSNNAGSSVELSANAERPDAKMDDIMFIGKDAGEYWEFTFPGGHGPAALLIPKTTELNRFEVEMEIVFDPATDGNKASIADSKSFVRFGEQSVAAGGEICYLHCNGQDFCGISPYCIICNGIVLKC